MMMMMMIMIVMLSIPVLEGNENSGASLPTTGKAAATVK